jgi:hypothetical protein
MIKKCFYHKIFQFTKQTGVELSVSFDFQKKNLLFELKTMKFLLNVLPFSSMFNIYVMQKNILLFILNFTIFQTKEFCRKEYSIK